MSTSNLSGVIQGGQTLGMGAGTQAINANDLVLTGGPGNEAYSVVTIDNAAVAAITTTAPTSAVTGAINNYARYDQVVDALGNSYFLTPNASSQGVNVSKRSPGNAILIASTALDATTHAMISMRLRKLASGNFVAVYVDSTTGGVKFVIFDTNLNIVAVPTAVATGYETGAVAYADATALSAGGFAVVYQNSAHSAIDLQTYSNAGAAVLAATSVQTITGTALVYLALGQLSNGNLVIGMRTTATPAGTSFVIVTTAGVSVVANTVIDSTATAGFCYLSILPGFFALADANGTNLQAAVYNNAGAQQGGNFTGATTLNSTTYAQGQLANDGNSFYLFFTLTAGGLSVVQLTTAGGSTASATILTGTFTATTTFGAAICNGQAFVLAASIATGGQYYITVGLPDAFLGASSPYVITGATSIGSAAATTGTYWPSVHAFGDFTAGVVYDQQTTAGTFAGMVKFAASSIQGVAQNAIATKSPGTALTVNPGPGSYPVNALLGTAGTTFDHSTTTSTGNRGVMYRAGVDLSNPATAAIGSAFSSTGFVGEVSGTTVSGTVSYTATTPTQINASLKSSAGGVTVQINGGADIAAAITPVNTAYLPIFLAAGQTVLFTAASLTGTLAVFAQKVS